MLDSLKFGVICLSFLATASGRRIQLLANLFNSIAVVFLEMSNVCLQDFCLILQLCRSQLKVSRCAAASGQSFKLVLHIFCSYWHVPICMSYHRCIITLTDVIGQRDVCDVDELLGCDSQGSELICEDLACCYIEGGCYHSNGRKN